MLDEIDTLSKIFEEKNVVATYGQDYTHYIEFLMIKFIVYKHIKNYQEKARASLKKIEEIMDCFKFDKKNDSLLMKILYLKIGDNSKRE